MNPVMPTGLFHFIVAMTFSTLTSPTSSAISFIITINPAVLNQNTSSTVSNQSGDTLIWLQNALPITITVGLVIRHRGEQTMSNQIAWNYTCIVHGSININVHGVSERTGVTRVWKGGSFHKNHGFSQSISKIFFCVADFYGNFQRFSRTRPPGDAHGVTVFLIGVSTQWLASSTSGPRWTSPEGAASANDTLLRKNLWNWPWKFTVDDIESHFGRWCFPLISLVSTKVNRHISMT
jgi:hypothetical protein